MIDVLRIMQRGILHKEDLQTIAQMEMIQMNHTAPTATQPIQMLLLVQRLEAGTDILVGGGKALTQAHPVESG